MLSLKENINLSIKTYINDSTVYSWHMDIPSASIYEYIHIEIRTHSNTCGLYGVTFKYSQRTTILTKRYKTIQTLGTA